jgi:hypothetical protein
MEAFPAVKFFSATDQSQDFPTPIRCVRVEKPVGTSWSVWAGWFKLARYLESFPFP